MVAKGADKLAKEIERLAKLTATAVDMSVKAGLPVSFVTEDTIRSHPDTLDRLFRTAIDHGATRLVLCDTVGHATPDGIKALVEWTRELVDKMGATVGLDWHGHNDRGLALVNAIFAAQYGCDRIHGTAIGIGERVGNTAMDQLLVNLKLLGAIDNDLSCLMAYCRTVSEATKTPIARNYPVVGEDAFRTATGVHAAAIIKAKSKGDDDLADRVYSGVPAAMFGRDQEICIGPMSGASNVNYWLDQRDITGDDALVAAILKVAKQSDHNLSDQEVRAVIDRHHRNTGG